MAGKNLMTIEQEKGLIRSFLKKLDKQRAAIDTFFSSSCLAHLPGNLQLTDREGFKQFVAMLYAAFPDLHHTVEDQIV